MTIYYIKTVSGAGATKPIMRRNQMARHKRKGTPLTWSIKVVGNVIVFLSTFQAKLLMMQGKRLNRN